MRLRIVQAIAIVALLHAITPLVDPADVAPAGLEQHYGETIELEGRVVDVEPNGDVVRLTLADGSERATVLSRGPPAPLGAQVSLRGQPSAGEHGPVVWSEGPLETREEQEEAQPVPLPHVLADASRWRGRALAVAGTWSADGTALVDEEGALPVEPAGIAPDPGPVVVWGRLVYEPERAGYELEATGWRPWTPPPR